MLRSPRNLQRWPLVAAALGAAFIGVLSVSQTVLAYPPPGATATLQAINCTSPLPRTTCQLNFTEVDANGNPVPGDSVTFTVVGGSLGSVNPATSLTDAKGVAISVFTAGPGCGGVTVTGTTARSSAQTVITVSCGVVPQAPGLPAAPPQQGGGVNWTLVIGGAAAVIVAGTLLSLAGLRRGRSD